jgi:hypothetical protein
MEMEALKAVISAVAPNAGLGEIAVGAVIWVFRGVIFQNIFPQLTKSDCSGSLTDCRLIERTDLS